MELLKRLFTEEEGQGLVEYALIVALVVFGIWLLISNSGIGSAISNTFSSVANTVNASQTGGS